MHSLSSSFIPSSFHNSLIRRVSAVLQFCYPSFPPSHPSFPFLPPHVKSTTVMAASSSVSNVAPSLDWADDTDDEIDFGAPVFSDDDDFPRPAPSSETSAPAPGSNRETATPPRADGNREPPRYTAGFTDGSNRTLDRRSHNGSALQPMSSRVQSRDHQHSYRDSPRPHHGHNNGSYGSPQSEGRWGKHTDSSRGSSAHSSAHPSRSSTPRTTIPLPPKPAPELDANNHRHNHQARMDRSRSPSYRSRSPLPTGGVSNDRLPWENSRQQRSSSPYTSGRGGGAAGDRPRRSLSPSAAHLNNQGGIPTGRSHSPSPRSKAYMDQVSTPSGRVINNPDGFSTGHSSSPSARPSRSYMDQVASPTKDRLNRRSRDSASEGRWEKTLQEDKPYPNLHPSSAANGSPKDDTVHFKRRETGPGRPSGHEPGRNDRSTGGTMYHERLEANAPSRSQRLSSGPSDRWEKAPLPEQDLPYPEPRSAVGNGVSGKHNRTGSRGKLDVPLLSSSPEKSSSRGSRGKGKDAQKRRSKDQPTTEAAEDNNAGTGESGKPWWEQSTYGAKSKSEGPAKPAETPQPKKEDSNRQERQDPQKLKATPSRTNATPSSKQEAPAPATKTKESEPQEVPWWEQSTYKAKPKSQDPSTTSVSGLTAQLAKANLNKDEEPVLFLATNRQKTAAASDRSLGDLAVDDDTLSRRRALEQKSNGSGVETLTLLSRGGDDSG